MKFGTYKKNKYLFEHRLIDDDLLLNDLGYKPIEPLLKSIYNRELFFFLYSYDVNPNCNVSVSSIDKNKRYLIFKKRLVSKIKVVSRNTNRNLLKSHGEYERFLPYAIKKINSK